MPRRELRFPSQVHDWKDRAVVLELSALQVVVPSVDDLLISKLKRGEPRDYVHANYVKQHALGRVA